jgi:hypothetical protein
MYAHVAPGCRSNFDGAAVAGLLGKCRPPGRQSGRHRPPDVAQVQPVVHHSKWSSSIPSLVAVPPATILSQAHHAVGGRPPGNCSPTAAAEVTATG